MLMKLNCSNSKSLIGLHAYLLSSSHFGNKTAMIEISWCLFRLLVSVLGVPVCGEWGVVYDLNIESKINLAGKAIKL